MSDRRGSGAARGVLMLLFCSLAAALALFSIAPLAPDLTVLGAVSADASSALAWLAGAPRAEDPLSLGDDGASIAFRAALAASFFALIAFPLSTQARLPGPRALAAPLALCAALLIGGAFAIGVGAELVLMAAQDPLAPGAADASWLFRIGYQLGYLAAVDWIFGALISWLESVWPSFASTEIGLSTQTRAPFSALVFASLVSFAALAPVWILVGLFWLVIAPRLFGGGWRYGGARLVLSSLVAALLFALFAAIEPSAAT